MLASLLLGPIGSAEAQEPGRTGHPPGVERGTLPHPYNLTAILATDYPDRLYIIDGAELEVQSINPGGQILHRYGGWGSGSEALDLPLALFARENTIFVLDQGRPAIVWLDFQLHQVGDTRLPQYLEPIGFVRNNQRQFWVIIQGRPGLHLYDDHGTLLTVIGDQASGDDAIFAPQMITSGNGKLLVWDDHRQAVCMLNVAGAVEAWLQFDNLASPYDLVFADNTILLLTDDAIVTWAVESGLRHVHALDQPLIHIFNIEGQVFTISSEGEIGAFTAQP